MDAGHGLALIRAVTVIANYRGRIAPSPTGLLHLGHAQTFWLAHERARVRGGTLLFRNDDLDRSRSRAEFLEAAMTDLCWLGINWDEGPDRGGRNVIYSQSFRIDLYRTALEQLHAAKLIFPCTRSRRDVAQAAGAPHEEHGEADEPVYPVSFRPPADEPLPPLEKKISVNWRFRVPLGEPISFRDGRFGEQSAICGENFGDFLVWRKDDLPSYQLACVVDDALMGITEVVRGVDLITSTFRQILLYRALGWSIPEFHHAPLVRDAAGARLAKRDDAMSLRALRERGVTPAELIDTFRKNLQADSA